MGKLAVIVFVALVAMAAAATASAYITDNPVGDITERAASPRIIAQTSASPSAPVACGATSKGYTIVVDDSDDAAGTAVCYCGMTDDSTYDWLDVADNTACSFF